MDIVQVNLNLWLENVSDGYDVAGGLLEFGTIN